MGSRLFFLFSISLSFTGQLLLLFISFRHMEPWIQGTNPSYLLSGFWLPVIQCFLFDLSSLVLPSAGVSQLVSSLTQSCLTLCNPMDFSMAGLPVHHQLPEFTQTHVHQVGNAIQPSHPLSSPFPPAFSPSIRVFSNESVLPIRWPKYWSFSFSISPSKECSGLISFRMDWLDLLAVQGTLKSLLQHHSSKVSILRQEGMYQYKNFLWPFCFAISSSNIWP